MREMEKSKSKSPLADRVATDGRMIVEEVEGRCFWPGQSFLADCGISASYRPAEHTAIYARRLTQRYNAHAPLVESLRGLVEIVREYRERVIKGEITVRLSAHDYEALHAAEQLLKESA